MSTDERDREARFVRQVDRDRYVAGRVGLRRILASYLGRDPRALSFQYNAWGKPEIALDDSAMLHFNLTHSAGQALAGVCTQTEIGVDIEAIGRLEEDVARHFFSATECKEIAALPKSDQPVAFYRCWTRKEAFVKAHGAGLSLPLDGFDVSLEPHQEKSLLRRLDPQIGLIDTWTLCNLDVGNGFCGALAVHSQGRAVRVRHRSMLDWSLNMASMM